MFLLLVLTLLDCISWYPTAGRSWIVRAFIPGCAGYLGDTTLDQTPLLCGSVTSLLMTGVDP